MNPNREGKMKFLFFGIVLWTLFSPAVSPAQARTIRFAGVDWYVKNGGPYGPGPNYWSDSEQSVWLDSLGRLHLTIRRENGVWYCSEVYTVQETAYGEHRFLIDGWVDRMDRNMVLGLFVYATDTSEIDIEFSKWGDAAKQDVGSFTVQPYWKSGHQHTFECPLDSTPTTNFFDWQPGYVHFGSMRGHYYGAPPSDSYYFSRWIYTGEDIPSTSDHLHTHINFWLMNGNAPQDLSVSEIIISDVVQPLQTSAIANAATRPVSLELKQNFPNPFNGSTRITYRLASRENRPTTVRLTLFDIRGRRVKSVFLGRQSPGLHAVTLNADGLAGGLYFYRLSAGKAQITRKMLLIR